MSEEKPSPRDDLREIEQAKFEEAIGDETDATMLVLRAHLFSESLLERVMLLKLPRGDKVVENGSFSYAQKLALVEAIDCFPDSIISSLRNLNKVRNQCAHELGKSITSADIVRMGSPLGKFFSNAHRQAKYEVVSTLRSIVNYVCGYVTGACHAFEEANAVRQKRAKPQVEDARAADERLLTVPSENGQLDRPAS